MPVSETDYSDKAGPITAKDGETTIDDGRLQAILRAEKNGSTGFDDETQSDDLGRQRQRALRYIKGDMWDVPFLPNRSSATDSTIADTIETILPDLMEIFTSEDAITFQPTSEEDVESARQETEYIRHVLFSENDGWLEFYQAFKDALGVKLGVWKWWYEEDEEEKSQRYDGLTEDQVKMALEGGGQLTSEEPSKSAPEGYYDIEVTKTEKKTYARFKAVPPEDFAAADDTVKLKDTTYCVMRSEPRIQTLIEEGYPEEKVMQLKDVSLQDREDDYARDTVDESDDLDTDTSNVLRRVRINEHHLRTDLDNSGVKVWKIVTNADESVILDREEMMGISFSTITPFINPHRLIGLSIADKTMEIQKIKTSLIRMMLDSGYFALNQRVEISDADSNEFTQGDLLRNEPGMFVRVKRLGAVKPIAAGALAFDVQGALEYASTMAEQRSGVIRNAQGLNPDSLHDTASGQQSILTMSQKRTRMIARSFAETGVKELCLGLHQLIRETATGPVKFRLAGEFVEVDPTTWPKRTGMDIQIGSGGKEEAKAALRELIEIIQLVVELQGGAEGPLIDMNGIYKVLSKFSDLVPLTGIQQMFTDPAKAPPKPPEPDPEMAKAQAEAQAKQQEMQMKAQEAQVSAQMKQQEAQVNAQLRQQELAAKQQESQQALQLKREEAAIKMQLMRDDAANKNQLARDKAAEEMQLAREKFQFETVMAEKNYQMQRENAARQAANQETVIKKNRPGGDLNK